MGFDIFVAERQTPSLQSSFLTGCELLQTRAVGHDVSRRCAVNDAYNLVHMNPALNARAGGCDKQRRRLATGEKEVEDSTWLAPSNFTNSSPHLQELNCGGGGIDEHHAQAACGIQPVVGAIPAEVETDIRCSKGKTVRHAYWHSVFCFPQGQKSPGKHARAQSFQNAGMYRITRSIP